MRIATNIDEARELCGGFGKFQLVTLICGTISEMRSISTVFGLAVFELQPKYLCNNSAGYGWYECLPEVFCNDDTIEYKVDYSKPESINSLFNRIHLECESKQTIGLIGSIMFLGILIGSMFFLRLADLYGRKPFVLLGNFISVIFFSSLLSL